MDRLRLDEHSGTVTLRVRAAPGASRDAIVGVLGEALKVAVVAPPERGKANARLLDVLAKALGLSHRSLTLLSGGAARDKRVRIDGMTAAELRSRLRACLPPE